MNKDVWLANRYMKTWLKLLAIRKYKFRPGDMTTHLSEWLQLKRPPISSADKDVEVGTPTLILLRT